MTDTLHLLARRALEHQQAGTTDQANDILHNWQAQQAELTARHDQERRAAEDEFLTRINKRKVRTCCAQRACWLKNGHR